MIEQVLQLAVTGGASDVILKVGSVPKFRFNKELVTPRGHGAVTEAELYEWIGQVMPPHLRNRFQVQGDVDFAIRTKDGYRFRANIFRHGQKLGIVLRVVRNLARSLEELQLPAELMKLTTLQRGLVLVTGATGSGKSTTLAAILNNINQTRAAHILTVEDPVEIVLTDARSTVHQREVGLDTDSFATALRAALRQSPDVIFVGELRDRETVETAISGAETGHLVLSTLHTIDAAETMSRLLSFFEPASHMAIRNMLSRTLVAVVSQRLVPRKNASDGLVAAVEILKVSGPVRDIIIKGESWDSLTDYIQSPVNEPGMQSFDQHLLSMVQSGVITQEIAIREASRPGDMRLRLSGVA